MNLIQFIINNSKLLPQEIISRAHVSGWNDDVLFAKLKEQGEYLELNNGEYVVTKIHGNLAIHENYNRWLEKRIDAMVRALC